MVHAKVLTCSQVDSLLSERGLTYGDDTVVSCMQCEVLPHAILHVIRPAVLACLRSKRTYVGTSDLLFAHNLNTWPSADGKGEVLTPRYVLRAVDEHIKLVSDICVRHKIASTVHVRVSKQMCASVQQEVEKNLRGFVKYLCDHSQTKRVGRKDVEAALSDIVGDKHYLQYERNFSVY